jgi:hypothetical protein
MAARVSEETGRPVSGGQALASRLHDTSSQCSIGLLRGIFLRRGRVIEVVHSCSEGHVPGPHKPVTFGIVEGETTDARLFFEAHLVEASDHEVRRTLADLRKLIANRGEIATNHSLSQFEKCFFQLGVVHFSRESLY